MKTMLSLLLILVCSSLNAKGIANCESSLNQTQFYCSTLPTQCKWVEATLGGKGHCESIPEGTTSTVNKTTTTPSTSTANTGAVSNTANTSKTTTSTISNTTNTGKPALSTSSFDKPATNGVTTTSNTTGATGANGTTTTLNTVNKTTTTPSTSTASTGAVSNTANTSKTTTSTISNTTNTGKPAPSTSSFDKPAANGVTTTSNTTGTTGANGTATTSNTAGTTGANGTATTSNTAGTTGADNISTTSSTTNESSELVTETGAQCAGYSSDLTLCRESSIYCKVENGKCVAKTGSETRTTLKEFVVKAYKPSIYEKNMMDAYKALTDFSIIKTKMKVRIEEQDDAIYIKISKLKALCKTSKGNACSAEDKKQTEVFEANFGPMLVDMFKQQSSLVSASVEKKAILIKIKKDDETSGLFSQLSDLSGIGFVVSAKLGKQDENTISINDTSFIKRVNVPAKRIAGEIQDDSNLPKFVAAAGGKLAKMFIKLVRVKLKGEINLDQMATLSGVAKFLNKEADLFSLKVDFQNLSACSIDVKSLDLSDLFDSDKSTDPDDKDEAEYGKDDNDKGITKAVNNKNAADGATGATGSKSTTGGTTGTTGNTGTNKTTNSKDKLIEKGKI